MTIAQAVSAAVQKVKEVFLPSLVEVAVLHGESNSKRNVMDVKGKPAKSSGRICWNGSKGKVVLRDPSGAFAPKETPDDTISHLRVFARFWEDSEPIELVASKEGVHTSNPSTYRVGHAKAGQIIPNTGGNRTLTFTKVVEIAERDAEGAEGALHRYTAMVSITRVIHKTDEEGKVIKGGKDNGYRVSARIIPRAAGGGNVVNADFEFLDDLED